MAVTPQSRYLQGSLLRLPNSVGTYNLSVVRTVPGQYGRFNLYVWQETDRPDIVAYNQLGNPSLWWAIFDINPEIIYPLNITPGTVVRIPIGPVAGQGTLFQ